MWVLLFDLDFTLVNTAQCLPYMTSAGGREAVVGALEQRTIAVTPYYDRLVENFNDSCRDNVAVVVLSDSPKPYCLKVLEVSGYTIDQRLVFGSQKKPMVDFEALKLSLVEVLGLPADQMKFLVVGDSPKDIYFAHRIAAPSIYARWGSRHDFNLARQSSPTRVAQTYEQLHEHVIEFLQDTLLYTLHNFYQDFDFHDPDTLNCIELDQGSIGHGKEYVPNPDHYRGKEDRGASRDLRWVIKPAKNYDIWHHRRNLPMQMYGSAGVFETRALKSLAGIYKRAFLEWLDEHDVHGKVLLVPVPPSVPRECNLSNPVAIISEFWSAWVTAALDDVEMVNYDVFRRIVPKQPSHDTTGRRHMDDQFPTLGVERGARYQGGDVDYVIILDDVVTSGAHMNAIASIINSVDLIPGDPIILGYALFKTVHPENDVAIDDVFDLSFLN